MACERSGKHGVAISQWDCRELAQQLGTEGAVEGISPQTVRRILAHHHLKPWRHHLWLSAHVPRDAAFAAAIREICDLHTRMLEKHEAVLCIDEKTSLQPRRRTAPTRPALPGRPVQVEQEYIRGDALNLFAAFDRHLHQFFAHWNRYAYPFNWNTSSVARVMAKCSVDDRLPAAA